MAKRITITLPADLLNRARRKAAAQGRTLASVIEDGLRLMLAENSRTDRSGRVIPRVSSVGVGVIPGVDLTDSAALQEMDDLDAIKGMNFER
jgi:CopG-like RHH_1 or ribbon-helix-helix domain, RHH_5